MPRHINILGSLSSIIRTLDPFVVDLVDFRMSKLLRPFSCLLRTPALVVLATHYHLKINFKPATVVTGGVMAN